MDFKNGKFTIKHTGIYTIHYFVKALTIFSEMVDIGDPSTLNIAVKINDKLRGYRKLNGFAGPGGLWFTGNGVIIENLRKEL